jgi:tRNA A22 N-methylase
MNLEGEKILEELEKFYWMISNKASKTEDETEKTKLHNTSNLIHKTREFIREQDALMEIKNELLEKYDA